MWGYYTIFVKFVILSWILRDYGTPLLKHIPALDHCKNSGRESDLCYGKEAVFRVSLALVLFFSVLFVVTFKASPDSPRDFFDRKLFWLKYLGVLALVFISFTLPGENIEQYSEVARVFGVLFLAFQCVQMLELFYRWNEWWVTKSEQDDRCVPVLISVTTTLYALSLTGVALAYHYFSGCDFNVVVTTLALAIGILISILSVSKFRSETSGLLSAAFCFTYCVYLLWSAMSSEPETCVQDVYPKKNNDWSSIISLLIMIVVVSLCCANSARDQESLTLSSSSESEFTSSLSHFIFLLSSGYFAMLFTGWDISTHTGKGSFDLGWASVWIKIASSWFTAALYIWTLFAPFILSNRSF